MALRPITVRLLGAAAAVAASAAVLVVPGSAGAAPSVSVNPRGSIQLEVRGNGHGHGMSQYGARGAAIAGMTYRQIVAFYYPHTHLTQLGRTSIRVRIGDTGSTVTVGGYPHLSVTGVAHELPAAHVDKYRLVEAGSTLTLQQLGDAAGAHWRTYATGLPNGATFSRTNHFSIRQFLADGSSTRFLGSLSAWRTRGGLFTVNRLSLDDYTAGVVPREMPASWEAAAVRAQAVAARTYGRYGVDHPQGHRYDICDSTMCQVYGGHVHYYSDGTRAWTDDQDAVTKNAGQVLTYGGAVIFAQFSASDGGYTADGGQPYLTAHPDPYDDADSGDPYLDYTRSATSSAVANYFGLAKITGMTITGRDGHGAFGGRVTSASLVGTTYGGGKTTKSVSGYDLQYAFGLGSTMFRPETS